MQSVLFHTTECDGMNVYAATSNQVPYWKRQNVKVVSRSFGGNSTASGTQPSGRALDISRQAQRVSSQVIRRDPSHISYTHTKKNTQWMAPRILPFTPTTLCLYWSCLVVIHTLSGSTT